MHEAHSPFCLPWVDSPRGRYLLGWEQQQVDLLVADMFGFNALQVGLCDVDYLRANRMRYRLRAGFGDQCRGVAVLAAVEELPFATQSLDLVVLPHVLEFSSHPHQVLREVERILLPEGQVVITGFNPFSLWGVRRALAGNLGEAPWSGQYLSTVRLRDWFSLLGFELRSSRVGCYAPPVRTEHWLRRWAFMEAVGTWAWPFAGGAYVMHAVKRVQGMRLITPAWRNGKRRKAMVPVAHKVRRN
ncbi:MAG: SAM-dependent methyltransferase [Candidatus Dactylopiibacterium carminicum]|uniref:SAM-dependent methyltransferase n=1 Tax=Candidatus Dactylopiibacterium carminicum TaxID=857335 RepID=A0A272EU10_9RHOO|nr:methyltransferase domain-containing protein [Candidatus Dactylopiibacterium carminicum]KAF7599645.1 class I SAM-dependent methyltransferase [Candidatus Dactylopiibacterium carminicum]PAS93577.1 MAG: SAM-dependent methyltransferase [Candidatus Dactylopiibacterium carminicum]PAS97430.1 MAG: SAM-dependent methyltransferase [Candidatus Dactylopiibacterium carminicum]PAS99646.1 MAG: SAM-dependent methyltransferase [Candidatus Dactylopiibacterium carminicum]